MSGKPSSTIAFKNRWNPPLSRSREGLLEALADMPPEPAGMGRSLRSDQGREQSAL
jgi:hypothetical protein